MERHWLWVRERETGQLLGTPLARGKVDIESIAYNLGADSLTSLTLGNGVTALRADFDGNSVLPWHVLRRTLDLADGTTKDEPVLVSINGKRTGDCDWNRGALEVFGALHNGAHVFFREENSSEVFPERIGQDGRLNLGNVAKRFSGRAGDEILVGGWPLGVDERGFTLATWLEIAGSLHGVDGSSEEKAVLVTLLFKKGWLELPSAGCQIFAHSAVTCHESLGAHARDFISDMGAKNVSTITSNVRDGRLFNNVCRQVWHTDLPEGTQLLWVTSSSLDAAVKEFLDRALVAAGESESEFEESESVIFGLASALGKAVPVIAFAKKALKPGEVSRFLRGRRFRLHDKLPITRELLFQVFAAARMLLKGDGIPRQLSQVTNYVLESSAGGQHIQFKVKRAFAHEYRGGTYVISWAPQRRAVLKRGPPPGAKQAANAFGLSGMDLEQVDTELEIRHYLGEVEEASLRIPRLICEGKMKDPPEWRGCTAFVTSFHGSLNVATLGVLPMDQVLDMGMSLVTTAAQLWRRGVRHEDICPRNVAYDEAGHGVDRFWLLDLGLAQGYHPAYGHFASNKVADLEFGSMDAVLGKRILEASSDFQSILFTMLVVAGLGLPWSKAVAEGARKSVVDIRKRVLRRKETLLKADVNLPRLFGLLEELMFSGEVGAFLQQLCL